MTPGRSAALTAAINASISGSTLTQVRDDIYLINVVARALRNILLERSEDEQKKELARIKEAFDKNPNLTNLLLDPFFRDTIQASQDAWRRVVSASVLNGVWTPAFATALEVLAAHGVETCIDDQEGYTPTPVISRQARAMFSCAWYSAQFAAR